MRKKDHGDEPLGKLKAVTDFLPPPGDLVPREDMVKITIAVDEDTLKFFKTSAKASKTKYQRMMREVLRRYASQYRRRA